MLRFVLGRFIRMLATMMVVLVFVFWGARVTGNPFDIIFPDGLPPNAVEALNAQFGLDQPLVVQFITYLNKALHGDFGISLVQRQPVTDILFAKIAPTLKLGFWALLFSLVVGVFMGIVCAIYPRHPMSKVFMLLSSIGYSLPGFIIAILLIVLCSYWLGILPSQGGAGVLGYIMPVLTLSAHPIASIARYTRSSVMDVISADYIKTAVAKGLGKQRTILWHVLRNACLPVLTITGILVADIITGSIVVETIFAWQGVGKVLVEAVTERDFPLIQFSVVFFSGVVICINFLVDVAYILFDPRIRIQET